MSEGKVTGSPMPQGAGGFLESFHTWRYFFWFLGIVGLVMLFYAEENWRGEWAWEKHKQELRARGESSDPSAYVPPRVPDDDNFTMTPILQPLFQFIPGTQRWLSTNTFANDQRFYARYSAASSLVQPKKGPRRNSWARARTDLLEWQSAFMQETNGVRHNKKLQVLQTNLTVQQAA